MPNYRYILIALCLLLTFSATKSYALDIQQIRFGAHPDKIRMVLDVSEVTDFRAFILPSPPRLVIDLPKFTWKAGHPPKPPQTMISDIRQGLLMPEISRIVFDLNKTVVIKSAFLLPKNGQQENRIVIDYKTANSQEFSANKDVLHGTLKIDDYKNKIDNITSPAPAQKPVQPSYKKQEKPLIIIDPGHGGQDPGAIGHYKIPEKKLVFSLAQELKKQLLASGKYRVMMTRDKDKFIRLKDRVKFARKHEGDLFISIHADSIGKSSVHGASIYTLSKKASDAQTAKLAEKENQADLIAGVDFNVEDEQVAFILGDFLINDTMNQSKFFANTLATKMKSAGINTLHNTHRYAGFAVLKAPDIPSILIEAGFVSNKKEARLLNKQSYRQKMAKAIISGINSYFNSVYKNESN